MNVALRKSDKKVYKELYRFKPSNVIILGSNKVKKCLNHFEYKYNILFKTCLSYKDLKKHVNKRTIALIIDEEYMSEKNMDRSFSFNDIPLFFLSRKKRRSSFYTKLYELGVHGIVD